MAAESKERVDHRIEAERWAAAAEREAGGGADARSHAYAANAQAHASLAIAEQLGELKNAVYDCLGDGSNLDRIKQAAEEMAAAR